MDRERKKVQQGKDMRATLYLWNPRDCYFVPINNNTADNSIFPSYHATPSNPRRSNVAAAPRSHSSHTPSYRVAESNEPSPAFHSGSSQPPISLPHIMAFGLFSRAIRCKKYYIQVTLPLANKAEPIGVCLLRMMYTSRVQSPSRVNMAQISVKRLISDIFSYEV